MCQFGKNAKGVSQLNNTHYEHTILVSNSVLSKIELFILTALSVCLYFGFYRNDISVGDNLKIVGVVLFALILFRLVLKIFGGVKVGESSKLDLQNGRTCFWVLLTPFGKRPTNPLTGCFARFTQSQRVWFSESIYIVKALGLQTTTVYNSNFKSTKFIPWHSINDVVINEAIVMQKVIFYLAVLVKAEGKKGEELITPVFVHAQPRLSELKKIYTNVQLILRN